MLDDGAPLADLIRHKGAKLRRRSAGDSRRRPVDKHAARLIMLRLIAMEACRERPSRVISEFALRYSRHILQEFVEDALR
ncbi:MAG TPA: hypothetical protein VFK06_01360, partial [Candidatus Angelobacter sp.]|nr:hypothetical protein [Candidatus Angelobacter sp.]